MINKHYKDLKTIKKHTKLLDYYFMGKYSFSPYMACAHACKYCDGRAEKYYVEGNFEKDIIVRTNVPHLLDQTLSKAREVGNILIGSGISDPYQPIESEEFLTRKSLTVIEKHGFPVSIMTKSDLILRDIDLIDSINKKSGALLMLSLVYTEDKHRQIFEPFASSVASRLNIIKAFKERNIPVCVLAMPLLPRICDDKKSLYNLMKTLKTLHVDAIMPGGLTLRPGKQKDVYFHTLENHYADLVTFYKDIYSNNSLSGSSVKWYRQQKMAIVYQLLSELKIPTLIPHSVYKGSYPKYDEVYFLLKHMKYLYKSNGQNIDRLKVAEQKYSDWYLSAKTNFNRRRSLSQRDLEDLLYDELIQRHPVILSGNQKLSNFILKAVFSEAIFDYTHLKLKV